MKRIVILVATVAALAACGEKPQALTTTTADKPAYVGTGSAFTATGWKQGDKTSWEQHLKARQQNSQNDYSKMN
jgi:predicted small lipoprotein YifL